MPVALAIDLGSSGVKVAIIDDQGRVLGTASEPLATVFTDDGGAQQDANDWWVAIGRTSAQALGASSVAGLDIGVVAVTSQYMSAVGVDAHGRPVTPVLMWMDSRGGAHHRLLQNKAVTGMWLDRHGLLPLANDDLAHVAYLRHRWPQESAAAAAFVEPVDALTARLTGRITATQSSAFGFLCVDNRRWGTTTYDPDLLAAAAINDRQLPPLVPAGEVIGTVTAEAAAHLGVTPTAVVLTGTIDSITSAIGTGAIDHTSVGLIIGTTSVVVTHVSDKRSDVAHDLITVPSPLPNRYFVMAENGVGGRALDAFLHNIAYADDALATGTRPDDAFFRAERAARSSPNGSNGVMYLPWLVGSMAPSFDSNMRGGFVNVSLTSTRADLVRAVFEGVAFNARWLLPYVADLAETRWASINVGGGGAQSALWCQVLADTLDMTVQQLTTPTVTNARGAALLAFSQLGHISERDIPGMISIARTFDPDPAHTRLMAHRAGRFVQFHELTRPFYSALNTVEQP